MLPLSRTLGLAGAALLTALSPSSTLNVSSATRLLVVAPHPDDEVLGAGGLIQRVRASGGIVRVTYLTDGDGYPEGVKAEDHVTSPTPDDYRGYGDRRRHEARRALEILGIDQSWLKFLNFPDGGLCRLTTKYWSERAAAYQSPYTRLDRPPSDDVIVPDTEYRGEDLTQEIARLIGDLRPTMILVPRKEDQHPDHCAAWFFVADALGDVARVDPRYRADLLTYIIHFDNWPFQRQDARLGPPPGLSGDASGWISFPLTDAEVRLKRAALQKYESQMHVMAWFLDGFARRNEIFSRPRTPRVVLPARRSLCCDR